MASRARIPIVVPNVLNVPKSMAIWRPTSIPVCVAQALALARGAVAGAVQASVKAMARDKADRDKAGRGAADPGKGMARDKAARHADLGKAMARVKAVRVAADLDKGTARDKVARDKVARDVADRARVKVVQGNPIHCKPRLASRAWVNLDAVPGRIAIRGRLDLAAHQGTHQATRPACRAAGRADNRSRRWWEQATLARRRPVPNYCLSTCVATGSFHCYALYDRI